MFSSQRRVKCLIKTTHLLIDLVRQWSDRVAGSELGRSVGQSPARELDLHNDLNRHNRRRHSQTTSLGPRAVPTSPGSPGACTTVSQRQCVADDRHRAGRDPGLARAPAAAGAPRPPPADTIGEALGGPARVGRETDPPPATVRGPPASAVSPSPVRRLAAPRGGC